MTSRHRSLRLLNRLTAVLLCLAIATAYGLAKALSPRHSRAVSRTPQETGTGLDRRVSHLHLANAPLERVVDDLARQTGQPIKVDWGYIVGDWGATRQTQITVDLDDVPLDSALQTVFGRAASQMPVRYGICRGVVTVSSRRQAWDVVIRTYDVSDLLQRFSDEPGSRPPLPTFHFFGTLQTGTVVAGGRIKLSASGAYIGAARRVFATPYTTGRIGPALAPTERAMALEDLTLLVYAVLCDDPVVGSPPPNVTQWGDRLLVVATETQQRNLEHFLHALRAKAAVAALAGAVDGTTVPTEGSPDVSDAILDQVIAAIEIPRMALGKALNEFASQAGVRLTFGQGFLKAHGGAIVEAHLHESTIREALNAILRQLSPVPPFFAEGRLVTIGVERMETRLYDLRPVIPPNATGTTPTSLVELNSFSDGLVSFIIGNIVPRSVAQWDGILVVYGRPAVHQEVSQLLARGFAPRDEQ